jgi:hypothetical protein
VTSPPVDLPAIGTDAELLVIAARLGFQPRFDRILFDVLQQAVAAGATTERPDVTGEVKAPQDFDRLLQRLRGADEITPGDDLALQQDTVAG